MQQPVCANCVRREEVCQYPASLNDQSLPAGEGSENEIPYASTSQGPWQERGHGLVQYQENHNTDAASITRYVE